MSFYIVRYKDIEEQVYDCEVVTPMFLGGADPKRAELRAASIKGMLRFWWRALYGSDDIKDMAERESEIFGSTEHKSGLLINISPQIIAEEIINLTCGKKYKVESSRYKGELSIIDYLAFGICERRNVYNRAFIKPGKKFKIELRYTKENKDEIVTAFKALISLGGLGSKTRNGFGSLRCSFNEKTGFKTFIEGNTLKDFSAFSSECRLFNFPERDTWPEALSDIGLAYREARLSVERQHSFNKRALIAMPIIAKGEERNIPKHAQDNRHGKPYYLHVNKNNKGKYTGQIHYMPYKYYEKNQRKMYLEVCNSMNSKIQEMMNASKGGNQ